MLLMAAAYACGGVRDSYRKNIPLPENAFGDPDVFRQQRAPANDRRKHRAAKSNPK